VVIKRPLIDKSIAKVRTTTKTSLASSKFNENVQVDGILTRTS
jgi:hypothetical protein